MRARPRDTEATRRAILDAAELLFAHGGYAKTAMSEVASCSQVTKSLIHHHFGSKDALWSEVLQRLLGRYEGALQLLLAAEATASPLAALENAISGYHRFLAEQPGLVRIIGWSLLEEDGPCRWMSASLHQDLIALVERGQREGVFRAELNATLLISQILSVCVRFFACRADIAQLVPEIEPEALDNEQLKTLLGWVRGGVVQAATSPVQHS